MSTAMVWFDFGGVLSPPLAELFRSFEEKTGVSPDRLQQAIADVGREFGTDPLAPIELAMISQSEWGERLSAALRKRHPDLDQSRARWSDFGEQWFDGVVVNGTMARVARQLRERGVRVGVLSNNVVEWRPYWRRILAPVGQFHCIVDSSEVGHRKPDPALFRLAEKAAGVSAQECVLVDDLTENCRAAESVGWAAVRFLRNEQATSELGALTGLHLT